MIIIPSPLVSYWGRPARPIICNTTISQFLRSYKLIIQMENRQVCLESNLLLPLVWQWASERHEIYNKYSKANSGFTFITHARCPKWEMGKNLLYIKKAALNAGSWKCQQDLPIVKSQITYDLHVLCSNNIAMSISHLYASIVHSCWCVYFVSYVMWFHIKFTVTFS